MSAGTWYVWCYGTSTTSATTTANEKTWGRWCSSTARTASTDSDTVWMTWSSAGITNARTLYHYQPAPETDEQRQARARREEEARIIAEERKRKDAEALQRAEDLLMLQLTAKQQKDFRTQKAFEVLSQSGKRFRIRNESSMNVDEMDERGKIIANHCIVSRERVPLPDQLVMQKLMLEHAEADFMQIANHRPN